jgi:hypothetical protein
VAKKAVTVVVDEKVIFTDLLKDNVADVFSACEEATQEIEFLKARIVRQVFPEFDWMYQVISTEWTCEDSPVKYCVYDIVEDPAHDDCLFCHDPEERK